MASSPLPFPHASLAKKGATFPSAVPTQIVSNEEFTPFSQTADQARVESRVVFFALEHSNLGHLLTIDGSRVHLGASGRERRIAFDDRREKMVCRESSNVAECLDAQRVRRDVDEYRADVDAGDQTALDRRAHCHREIGFDLRMHGATQSRREEAMHHRRAGGPANEQHLVNLVGADLRVPKSVVDAFESLGE